LNTEIGDHGVRSIFWGGTYLAGSFPLVATPFLRTDDNVTKSRKLAVNMPAEASRTGCEHVGENMWLGEDDFHFAWKKITGARDLALTADIVFLG
jgi:hypothetical protein